MLLHLSLLPCKLEHKPISLPALRRPAQVHKPGAPVAAARSGRAKKRKRMVVPSALGRPGDGAAALAALKQQIALIS